jgi:hypothetical protein
VKAHRREAGQVVLDEVPGMQDDCSDFLSYPPPDAIEANTNFRPWGQTE